MPQKFFLMQLAKLQHHIALAVPVNWHVAFVMGIGRVGCLFQWLDITFLGILTRVLVGLVQFLVLFLTEV